MIMKLLTVYSIIPDRHRGSFSPLISSVIALAKWSFFGRNFRLPVCVILILYQQIFVLVYS